MTNMLDFGIVANKFRLQSSYYIYFWINNFEKAMGLIVPLLFLYKNRFGIK